MYARANKMTFIGSTGWPSRRTNETKRPEKVDELELRLPTTGFYRILFPSAQLLSRLESVE